MSSTTGLKERSNEGSLHTHPANGHSHEGHSHSADCGCGHDHSHEGHSHSAPGHIYVPSCGCGHDHSAPGHIHGPDCGCGHDHGHEGHDHGSTTSAPYDKQALIAGFALLLISFVPMFSGTVSALMIAAATLLVGYPLFLQGARNLSRLSFDELSLLTIAVGSALVISEGLEAMMVTLLFRIGEWLESKAIAKSRRDIEALTEIRPDTANLVGPDDSPTQVPAYTVQPGSVIMVRPGERVPLDCEVISGSSYIDTSALTGEPLPKAVGVGDSMLSGSINTDGLLRCRTLRSFDNSAASRIIRMVEESQAQKGGTEKLISRFSRVYTPIVMALAVALALLPPMLGMGELKVWVMRALVFLVASCPCAFVIAVPLTFFSGVGAASRMGVLVKGTKYIEVLATADCVAFDKTGTLTKGVPTVKDVIPALGVSREEVVKLAATAEQYSNHPAAKAVVAYAGYISTPQVLKFSEITGMGVVLTLESGEILCGSARLMSERGVDIRALPEAAVYVARDGKAIGAVTLTDAIRSESAQAISELKALGADVYMLSGDAAKAAEAVGRQVGIDNLYAELLPEQKVSTFNKIKQSHRTCLYVGDGINDAPTLALADAGVAMGLGTDTAIEAADVVLMGERLRQLPGAMGLSRSVMSKAKFNIAFAMIVKIGVLTLGACGMASMWMAVFADVGVSIICILNALTLLAHKSPAINTTLK